MSSYKNAQQAATTVREATAAAMKYYNWRGLSEEEVRRLPSEFKRKMRSVTTQGYFAEKMHPGHKAVVPTFTAHGVPCKFTFPFRVTSGQLGSYKYLPRYRALGIVKKNHMLLILSDEDLIIPAVSSSNIEGDPFVVFKAGATYKFVVAGANWRNAHQCNMQWPQSKFELIQTSNSDDDDDTDDDTVGRMTDEEVEDTTDDYDMGVKSVTASHYSHPFHSAPSPQLSSRQPDYDLSSLSVRSMTNVNITPDADLDTKLPSPRAFMDMPVSPLCKVVPPTVSVFTQAPQFNQSTDMDIDMSSDIGGAFVDYQQYDNADNDTIHTMPSPIRSPMPSPVPSLRNMDIDFDALYDRDDTSDNFAQAHLLTDRDVFY